MSNVTNIRHAMPISAEINKALLDFSVAMAKAIDDAKAAGLPQGFVVAILNGQAHSETAIMVS
ncbi:hypothetical protein D3C87_1620630 [compost metagenome]